MPAADQTKITEPVGDGTLNRRSSKNNAKMHGGKRKDTASTRPTPSKVTVRPFVVVWTGRNLANGSVNAEEETVNEESPPYRLAA